MEAADRPVLEMTGTVGDFVGDKRDKRERKQERLAEGSRLHNYE